MTIASTIARYLLALVFIVFGLNGFLHFIPQPPPSSEMAGVGAVGCRLVRPPARSSTIRLIHRERRARTDRSHPRLRMCDRELNLRRLAVLWRSCPGSLPGRPDGIAHCVPRCRTHQQKFRKRITCAWNRGLTRGRQNFSAFNYGQIPSNPLAWEAAAGGRPNHAKSSARIDSEAILNCACSASRNLVIHITPQ